MLNSGRKRLVFFGNERVATGVKTDTPHLRMLLDEGYEIVAVVIKQEQKTSRKNREIEVKAIAEARGIPVLAPKQLSDITDQLVELKAEAGILVAYGKIIPQSVIDIFPCGIINIHPSLLPRHRGPTPLESVILNGETQTGVSIMSLVKAMDAGPVYAQSRISLTGTEAKQELADMLSDISVSMLKELLPDILRGAVVAAPQDDSHATYDRLLKKSDGTIGWTKPAAQIEREVRAFAGWPKSTTKLNGLDITVIEASVLMESYPDIGKPYIKNGSLVIPCGVGSLQIKQLQPAGKTIMDAAAFIRGYGNKL